MTIRKKLDRAVRYVRKGGPYGQLLSKLSIMEHRLASRISTIERQSHGSRATYVGNNRVLMKCIVSDANIAYYVEADDRLLSPWFIVTGEYETDLTKYLLTQLRVDSHCIDVGANFGYFTCMMARFCPQGRVIGIEADRHVFELVRDNIAINGFSHARAIHAALSDRAGDLTLFRRKTRSGNTSMIHASRYQTDILGEAPAEPFQVQSMRIDDLSDELGGRVDLIKIDVEGAEPLVMAGAAKTIASNPQLSIVMEWAPNQLQEAGFDIGTFLAHLAAMGLSPFDLIEGQPTPLSYNQLAGLPYRTGVLLRRA